MSRQLTLPSVARVEYAWPAAASRPKHRLREAGPDALSDAELVAVVLGMDDAEGVRRLAGVLEQTRGLAGLRSCSPTILAKELGTDLRAGKLGAALELARRVFRGSGEEPPTIRCPQDAAVLLIPEMGHLEQEQLRVLLLNTRHQVARQVLVYVGNVNTSMIRVAEVFREAVREGCPAILVGHNHPSKDPTPSPEDAAVTKQIVEAGKLLDCEVVDHVIIGGTRWVSLRERGLGGWSTP